MERYTRGWCQEINTLSKAVMQGGLIDVEGEVNNPGHWRGWSTNWFELAEKEGVKVENTMTTESIRNSILSLQQERVSLQEKIVFRLNSGVKLNTQLIQRWAFLE